MPHREPHILFVDDHEDTRLLVAALLARRGYSVTAAASCAEGLRLAEAAPFDLFLLDYQLGDGTGRELCEHVRRLRPGAPVLFFTASHPNLRDELLACGAEGFVLKPDIDGLTEAVGRALCATGPPH